MKRVKIHKSFFIVIAMIIIVGLFFIRKNVNKQVSNLNAETLRALNYEKITDEDMYVENCRSVQFGAYFARDIDGDGYADKLLGTCKQINSPDNLWINVNVSGDGYLKDGEIAINGKNFKYKTNILKGSQIKENYVSDNTKNIKLNDLTSGNNCAITGQVMSDIMNKDSYSSVSSITLTGTYVSEDGEEIEISKTTNITVDWYGTALSSISGEYNTYDISQYTYNEEDPEGTYTIKFKFKLYEYNKQLTVKSNIFEVQVPELFGYKPVEATCANGTYNEETRIISVNKDTTSTKNDYVVSVTYPKKAFERIYNGYNLAINIKGKIECYNNPNEGFSNPYVTKESTGVATAIFEEKNPIDADYVTYLSIADTGYCEYKSEFALSKQKLLDAYSTQDEISNMRYTVAWKELKTKKATLDGSEILFSEDNDGSVYGDSIDGRIMNDYISNIGIYFDEYNFLDKTNGTISVYNGDTNELVKTFSYDEIKQYTSGSPYYYDKGIQHVRVETSTASVVSGTYLTVYNIKELDTKKVMNDFTEEEVYSMDRLTTSIKSVLKNGGATGKKVESYSLIGKKTGMNVSLSESTMASTEVLYNEKITINAINGGDFQHTYWKNGIFLVEIPKDIIQVKVNDVAIKSDNVQILDWSLYKENGINYIKIITGNDVPAGFSLVIDCDLTPNPLMGVANLRISAYGYNEYNNNYWNGTRDKYDINGDNNTIENVAFDEKYIGVSIQNTTFVTVETVSNYNEDGDITITPNVAEVSKDGKSAQINVAIKNNYQNVVDEVQILGKIPFAGNTYINGTSLNSEYTTPMKNSGIQVPEALKDVAKVYYSTNEAPTEDLTDPNNGWKLKENIENFEDVRSYLIILEDYELKVGESYEFNYEVEIPSGVDCNKVTYGCHKVNYYLRVDDGSKLALSVQPNKAGIRIVRNYNLKMMKYKKGTTLGIQGATYRIREELIDDEEQANSRLIISDSNGVMSLNKLRANQVYTLEEIKAPRNYELNNEVIKFKVEEQEDETLKLVVLQGEFAGTAEIIRAEDDNDVLLASVEDEPKYKLEITKVDSETDEPLVGVMFELNGEKYATKTDGKFTIDGLSVGKEYSLKETYSNGYYNSGEIKFTVVKNGNDYTLNSDSAFVKDAVVSNGSNEDLADAKVTIVNEKIPTYNLTIEKVEENKPDNKLKGARFLLKRADLDNSMYYTTDENGIIEISDLYQYVEGKSITGKYILQEVEEPYGYMLNKEQISFTVSKNEDGILEMNIENQDELDTVKSIDADENNVRLVIQDKPLFKITKTDKETNEVLANAEFIIYELNKETGAIIDYAKDANGDYVGKQNENGDYTVTTDKSGTATAPLRNGVYKMIEVGYPEGYKELSNEEVFEITSGRKANTDDDSDIPELKVEDNTTETLEINYIEDLVDLSNNVNSGTSKYENTTVKLMRDLDFNEDSSYKNPSDTSYGDLNGDGTTNGIKEELTDKNGCGFTPIGKELPNVFSGIFNGQKHEIRNLYIKFSDSNAGLFGAMINCKVKDLGVTGTITGDTNYSNYVGAICGKVYGYVNVENCYSKCDITSELGSYVGGLIGTAFSATNKSYIINSYNTGNIIGCNEFSGIIGQIGYNGYSDDAILYVINCYNTGSLRGTNYGGGIVGQATIPVYIKDCYNTADIIPTGSGYNVGGIIGYIDNRSNNTTTKKDTLKNCYNIGNIVPIEDNSNVGGIIGEYNSNIGIDIIECYNTGNIKGEYIGGIIGNKYGTGSVNMRGCYNTGHITSKEYSGGIAGKLENGGIKLTECYNIGNIDATNQYLYTGGIVGYFYNVSFTIESCYNEGNLETSNTKATYFGGIVGNLYGSGKVNNSYNIGNIKASENEGTLYIGGIIGFGMGSIPIENCYNKGNIEYSKTSEGGFVGGIIGSGSSYNGTTTVVKCYNTGNIISESNNLINNTYAYCGGIAGDQVTMIDMCYNTGNIKSKIITSAFASAYIGGIAGNRSSQGGSIISNSYNIGDIDNYVVSSKTYCSTYTGGIASGSGRGTIINTYNAGNIRCYNCSNDTNSYSYVGGIAGQSDITSENNYNIGSVYNNVISPDISKTAIYTGAIFGLGLINDNDTNYYLKDIEIVGDSNVNSGSSKVNGNALSGEYMKSKEFSDLLSQKGDYWEDINNQYPTLDIASVSNAQKVTELSVANTKKTFDITTEIAENEYQSRVGGTITGEYNDKYISTNYKKFIETVSYGDSNKNQIEIIPSDGYKISKITVNGERIEYKENENGSVTIPAGYFEKVNKNYNIAVTFTQTNNIFTLNKVDENGNSLKNAKFKIDQVEDRPEVTDQVKDIVGNSNVYTYINKDDDATDLLGELTNNGTYYFVKQSDGTYIPNNSGVASSIANSYMKIDLTNKTGSYKVVINAKTSTQSGQDIGLAAITQTTDAINNSTSAGRFIYTSGTVASREYTSARLEGGNTYYLHLAYSKNASVDTGDDKMTINSVNLYGLIDETYDFNTVDGKYISTNQGKNGTYSMSYIPIDLSESTGKYTLTVNAEISSQNGSDRGYVLVSDNTGKNFSSYTDDGKFIYLTGSVEAKDYKTVLEGGSIYYLHMVYFNNSNDTDNGTDTFTINSVNLSLNTDDFYHEENIITDEDGKIIRGLKYGKYEIVETEAPEGYTKNDEVITYIMSNNADNNLTVTNKALKDVVVHYYEKETGSEFDKDPVTVSDDVTLYGSVGDWYQSDVLTEVVTNEGIQYNLIKDNNGEYVIPDNASGKYENNQIDVYYYYEKNVDIGYTIEHYYENKETGEYDLKYTDSKTLTEQAIVELKESDYKLEQGYEFERQEGSPIAVRDNSEDNVIKVYYKIASFDYTVHYFYEGVEDTDSKETLSAKYGDKITTYTDKNKAGYVFEKVTPLNNEGKLELTITDDVSNNVINVYYVKNTFSYTVHYFYDNVEDTTSIETLSGKYGDKITTYADKNKAGYAFEKVTPLNDEGNVELTITENEDNNIINVYYKKATFEYTIHYFYDNVEDTTLIETLSGKYGDKITTYTDKNKEGYIFEKVTPLNSEANLELTITDKVSNNVINVYYERATFTYTVHYFYDNVEDITLIEILSAKYGDKITTYTDKKKTGYLLGAVTPLNEEGNLELTITDNKNGKEDKNIINVYYVKQYQITTDVVEHTEVHKDGKVDQQIKGGNISGEDNTPYEEVAPGGNSKLPIELDPDEGYQIVKITINNKEFDFTDKLTQDGKVVFEEGYFANVTENKHIVVEFRKTATVTVKYLDKENKNPISDEVENKGYEGKSFETKQKTISTYQFDSVTDEDGNEVMLNGNMPAEGLVVIYWYNKVESGIIERHMEIEKDGTIQQIATETHKGKVGTSIQILRKQMPGYEAVNGTESTEENVISMKKDENTISVMYEEGKTIEVIYYYSKVNGTVKVTYKDNITGQEIKESQIISGNVGEPYEVTRTDIPGYKLDLNSLPNNEKGTFTEKEVVVEYLYIELRTYDLQVIYKANNELMDGAKIKVQKESETVVDDYTKDGILQVEKLELTDLLTQKYTIYETETPEHCNTIVTEETPGIIEIIGTFNQELKKYEFKISYNDISGFKAEVDETHKKINVYIETTKIEKYNLAIKKFISAIDDESIDDRAPIVDISENGEPTYKLNDMVVEASNNQKIQYTIRMYNESDITAKGKRIIEYIPDGLVYVPNNDINKQYEWVMYGKDSEGKVFKTDNPEEAVILVTDILVDKEIKAFDKEKDNTLNYLDVQVVFDVNENKITSSDRVLENKVIIMQNENDDYPENDESTEKLYVKYFDLNLEKYIDEIKIKNKSGENGRFVNESQSNQLVKVDVKNSEINNTTINVTYGLKVKNIGEIPGYATEIIDYIPDHFKLVENEMWKKDGNIAISTALENELINPGESKTIKITFELNLSDGIIGSIVNEAKISKCSNDFNAADVINDNNIDKQEMLITVKTGSEALVCIGTALAFIAILVTGIIFNKKIVK